MDEEKKLVTVARAVYAKRDIGRLLEWWKVEWLRRLRKLRITVECLNRLYAVDVGETMLWKKVSHLVKATKARYSICHTGSAVCNFERMGIVEISSSRAPIQWYNERVKGRPVRTKRKCRRYFTVYATYAKACASERIVNNKESQTFNRGRFNRCWATAEGQQGLADLCPFRS